MQKGLSLKNLFLMFLANFIFVSRLKMLLDVDLITSKTLTSL